MGRSCIRHLCDRGFEAIKGALIGGLDAKIEEIRREVEEAEKLREEAQSLLANYQRQQRQAMQTPRTSSRAPRKRPDVIAPKLMRR